MSQVRCYAGERREQGRRLEACDLPWMPFSKEGEAVANEDEIQLATFTGGCNFFKNIQTFATCRGAGITPASDVVARSNRVYAEVHLPLTHVMSFFHCEDSTCKRRFA